MLSATAFGRIAAQLFVFPFELKTTLIQANGIENAKLPDLKNFRFSVNNIRHATHATRRTTRAVLVYTAGTAMTGPLFCPKKTKMPFFAVIKYNLAHDLFKFCYIYTFSRVAIEISQILEELTQSLKKVY